MRRISCEKVSCRIDEVISYLQKKKLEGYTTVELIDDVRATGWVELEPCLKFVFKKSEPTVLGIDARSKKKQ